MQNNVTELSQKLLRSLDSNYNVIDMPTVIEIISLLEKAPITKELLETTRLGKHVNELRRNTKNESLAKRAKVLVKKWRDLVLPELNGQIKSSSTNSLNTTGTGGANNSDNSHHHHHHHNQQADLNLNQVKSSSRKRNAKDNTSSSLLLDGGGSTNKRSRLNGQHSELDLSDNSNSSFFDQQQMVSLQQKQQQQQRDVIVVNDDSNGSLSDRHVVDVVGDAPMSAEEVPELVVQEKKKRGRKKGTRNHSALLEEAATSFTNKMNATRNTDRKVKTTQELLADIQNKSTLTPTSAQTSPGTSLNSSSSAAKPQLEDMNARAAKLTERVSIIDQKLNASKTVAPRKGFTLKNVTDRGLRDERDRERREREERQNMERRMQTTSTSSFSASMKMSLLSSSIKDEDDEDVVVVDDDDDKVPETTSASASATRAARGGSPSDAPLTQPAGPASLSVEEALSQLPPVDKSCLYDPDPDSDSEHLCTCTVAELRPPTPPSPANVGSTFEPEPPDRPPGPEDGGGGGGTGAGTFVEAVLDPRCPAMHHFVYKYKLHDRGVSDASATDLSCKRLPSVNGNYSSRAACDEPPPTDRRGLYVNVVPKNEEIRLTGSSGNGGAAEPPSENYNKYSISNTNCTGSGSRGGVSDVDEDDGDCEDGEGGDVNDDGGDDDDDDETETLVDKKQRRRRLSSSTTTLTDFREWHETLDVESYGADTFRILPYVIID